MTYFAVSRSSLIYSICLTLDEPQLWTGHEMRDVRWGTVERRNGCPEIGTVYGELYGYIYIYGQYTFKHFSQTWSIDQIILEYYFWLFDLWLLFSKHSIFTVTGFNINSPFIKRWRNQSMSRNRNSLRWIVRKGKLATRGVERSNVNEHRGRIAGHNSRGGY